MLFQICFQIIVSGKAGNRDYELVLDGVTSNDDAEYTMVAENILGSAKTTAQLIVDSAVRSK